MAEQQDEVLGAGFMTPFSEANDRASSVLLYFKRMEDFRRMKDKQSDKARKGCLPFLVQKTIQPSKIVSCAEGFSLYSGEKQLSNIRWDQIEKIAAYKLDHITIDLLYLDIRTIAGERVTIHEFLSGFDEFRKHMEQALPTILPGWWSTVVFPPFEENYTIIYRRTLPGNDAT